MVGERFTRLVVVELNSRDSKGNRRWLCKCDCGAEHTVLHQKLVEGNTKSCGCLQREFNVQQKATAEKERRLYTRKSHYAMVNRCTNPKAPAWPKYGAKGVTVCNRWLKGDEGRSGWECFYADMGPRQQGLSIDRIDGTGNYELANCRWATQEQQTKNRRPRTKKVPPTP